MVGPEARTTAREGEGKRSGQEEGTVSAGEGTDASRVVRKVRGKAKKGKSWAVEVEEAEGREAGARRRDEEAAAVSFRRFVSVL